MSLSVPSPEAITLHELRNQLGVLMVQLEVARLQATSLDLPKALTASLNASAQAASQMSQILETHRTQSWTFNQSSLNLQPLNLQPLNLGTWLKEQIRSFQPVCDASGVSMSLNVFPENCSKQDIWIRADKDSLGQVVLNLLKNALEAVQSSPRLTPLEAIQVAAIQVNLSLEQAQAVITIEDNGTGFSVDLGERLFQAGVTHKATGSGIGLWLSRQMIEAHGGALTLHSDGPDLGCRACVRLPIFMPE
jgi:signal transduction histidine kinase